MSSDIRNIVLCITFGHASSQVSEALEGAVAYSRNVTDTIVLVVDDCSANAPRDVEGALLLETPSRRGFAGAVNFVLGQYPDFVGRLLLINPDAGVSREAVSELLSERNGIAVPQVLNPEGRTENIRRVTNAREQLLALLLGENFATRLCQNLPEISNEVACPPFAPSGSVMSYPVQMLRNVPLRDEFFWLEQSDWILRYAKCQGPINVTVLPVRVTHTGASTSTRYPVSVAASQLRTKVNFIHEYGNFWLRLVVPLGVLTRSLRFAIKTRQPANAWFLTKVAAGLSDWRVSK